ncbi:TlpA family protein disulfide reductase [Kordia sp. YSTF-M3]|uniref:TlpA family protein disulfide reductase n=1 Tax=Kordia aestuariivivens TaxID=2759037 RepID=A0ABR7Q668_9FLAO|nr:TlpA disulfide reductase family protein [Kordia aestuariivivens]MBC8753829.1 TlpA family protein disulfide reductase [Kordia aestuariivivens]
MNKVIIATLLFLLCISCASDTKTEKKDIPIVVETIEKPVVNTNPVTFIISNKMNNEYVSIYRNLAFDTFTQDKHVYTDKAIDTIQLTVNLSETIYVTSKFSARDTLHIKNGDTIYLNLANKQLKTTHSKAENLQIFKLKNDKIDSLTKTFYYVDYKAPFNLQSDKYQKVNPIFPLRIDREKFKTKPTELVQLANALIDRYKMLTKKYESLSANEPKNVPYYTLLKDELNYALFFELNRFYSYSKNEDIKRLITSELFFNEKTIDEATLYKKLSTFNEKIVLKNKRIKEKFKLKIDYKKAFDSLSTYIEDRKLLPLAKFVAINGNAMQRASKEELITMIEVFRNEFPEEKYDNYLQKIKEDYGLTKSRTTEDANTVHIVDTNGKVNRLDTFLEENKGKVIYIDFWASWCAPCRAVMPDSKKLSETYARKDVVFTYISIDQNKSHWKNAVAAEDLKTSKTNFLATNYTKAAFFKELEIKTIPRYLLFDKTGKLVHQNAPGPDSDEIKDLIDQYLKK